MEEQGGMNGRVIEKERKGMSEIALVTGGARGIGFGVSKALAKEGVNIAVF